MVESNLANHPAVVKYHALMFDKLGEDAFTDSGDTAPKNTAADAKEKEERDTFPKSYDDMQALKAKNRAKPAPNKEAEGFFPSLEKVNK